MAISRRRFVGCVAGSLTAGLSLDLRRPVDAGPRRVLLDLGEHCGLRESVAGYESALAGLGTGVYGRGTGWSVSTGRKGTHGPTSFPYCFAITRAT